MRGRYIFSVFLLFVYKIAVCSGQVVQLPTFHQSSVSTSVLVPDRGIAHLGGIQRAAYARSRFGVPGLMLLPGAGWLLGDRCAGSRVSTSTSSVHVTVVDLAAMDRALLANARAANSTSADNPRAVAMARAIRQASIQAVPEDEPLSSVADIRRANEQRKQARQREGLALFARAEAAEAAGHIGAAKIYYRMAARRVGGEMRAKIKVRLAKLAAPKKSVAKK